MELSLINIFQQKPSPNRAHPNFQFQFFFNRNIMSNNVSLHRIVKASPEKVFRAFTNANAIAPKLKNFVQ